MGGNQSLLVLDVVGLSSRSPAKNVTCVGYPRLAVIGNEIGFIPVSNLVILGVYRDSGICPLAICDIATGYKMNTSISTHWLDDLPWLCYVSLHIYI